MCVQSASSHHRRGLDVMCPSAASTMTGLYPSCLEMSSNCDLTAGCGKTFSTSDLTVYCGRFCLMVRSMLVICWRSEPSSPERPGGVSRTREWSLHGGAAVTRMM